MMREQQEYRLSMEGQYVWDAFAMLLQCDRIAVQKYVQDCINEFQLFKSDGEYFWSESLRRRMVKVEEKSVKARASAEARWNKAGDANAMRSGCERNAIKEKESKDIKDPPISPKTLYGEYVFLADDEWMKLLNRFGEDQTKEMIEMLDNKIGENPKRKPYCNYASHYRVLLGWVLEEHKKRHPDNKVALAKKDNNLMELEDDLKALRFNEERRRQLEADRSKG
jgi:hypothetical protein